MLEELASLRLEKKRRSSRRKIDTYFPDRGPLRRELYRKHLEFFRAGQTFRERLMLAANRVGKTEGVGGYETAVHSTGQYPEWWEGRRFPRAIRAWAAGDTGTNVREILQAKLLGPVGAWGTGLLPGDSIERIVRKTGTPDAVDTVYVKHKAGGTSAILFKSYEQGRESFQGTEQDLIWLDEEPPLAIYTESLLRTMTNNGMVMMTFTPLRGISEVVLCFLPGGKLDTATQDGSKYVVMATWDDAPHLTDEAKAELLKSIPAFQRDARSKGVPQLGSGAIYQVSEEDITCTPFEIPSHFVRGFGMDTDQGVGWTAAVWGARDRSTGILYLYDCYKRSRAELSGHIAALKSRGDWIPGVADAAALRVTEHDAEQLIRLYQNAGLNLVLPDKSVEAGIQKVWEAMCLGKLKVFKTCQPWFEEFRLYRRDEKGFIVKANDHLMDATRYLMMTGMQRMITKPIPKPKMPVGRLSVWS